MLYSYFQAIFPTKKTYSPTCLRSAFLHNEHEAIKKFMKLNEIVSQDLETHKKCHLVKFIVSKLSETSPTRALFIFIETLILNN